MVFVTVSYRERFYKVVLDPDRTFEELCAKVLARVPLSHPICFEYETTEARKDIVCSETELRVLWESNVLPASVLSLVAASPDWVHIEGVGKKEAVKVKHRGVFYKIPVASLGLEPLKEKISIICAILGDFSLTYFENGRTYVLGPDLEELADILDQCVLEVEEEEEHNATPTTTSTAEAQKPETMALVVAARSYRSPPPSRTSTPPAPAPAQVVRHQSTTPTGWEKVKFGVLLGARTESIPSTPSVSASEPSLFDRLAWVIKPRQRAASTPVVNAVSEVYEPNEEEEIGAKRVEERKEVAMAKEMPKEEPKEMQEENPEESPKDVMAQDHFTPSTDSPSESPAPGNTHDALFVFRFRELN
ncbi:hypothetical protein HK104_003521 [Borealophlyctis nickersoniae]|nr:hypothetical protein HK104_003521 [Borealophlyctis nickersoniae]